MSATDYGSYDPPRVYRPGDGARPRPPRPRTPYPPTVADGYDPRRYDSGRSGGGRSGGGRYDDDGGGGRYETGGGGYETGRYGANRYERNDFGGADGFLDTDGSGFAPLPAIRGRGGYRSGRRFGDLWTRNKAVVAAPLVIVLLLILVFATRSHAAPTGQTQQTGLAAGAAGAGGQRTGASAPAAAPSGMGTDAGAAAGQADPNASATAAAGMTATTTPGRYEAEDALQNTLGPTTNLRNVAGASGGVVVTGVGHGTPNGDVRFDAVTADAAGTYNLTISYLLADTVAHRLALWVNGKGPTILSFKPLGASAADTIGTYHTTVNLNQGDNTIRFSNATTSYGPDLDCITVTPTKG